RSWAARARGRGGRRSPQGPERRRRGTEGVAARAWRSSEVEEQAELDRRDGPADAEVLDGKVGITGLLLDECAGAVQRGVHVGEPGAQIDDEAPGDTGFHTELQVREVVLEVTQRLGDGAFGLAQR